jgi:50S ribosomal subunit-associated GTPase HflX
VDFHQFVEQYGMDTEDGRRRAKESTEGVIEAIRWLEDMDGILLIMDASLDPFNQVNITILGNLEARDLPVLIMANKIDLETSSPATIKSAFPQHPVVPVSALTGYNIDNLYKTMVKYF